MQYDRVGKNVASGELRPRVTLRWDRGLAPSWVTRHAAARTATTRSAATRRIRSQGFITEGDVHTNNLGPVHPGRLDGEQQADDQRRPPHRA